MLAFHLDFGGLSEQMSDTNSTLSVKYENSLVFAQRMDEQDPLKIFRNEFLFPKTKDGKECLYFAGNSLGLQPKKSRQFIIEELEDWEKWGVEGHWEARHPWLPYHEFLTHSTSRLVGAKPEEVVVMNTLTVNLHLMMVSFYRPIKERYQIIVEGGSFPSDKYAVDSQARFHGFDPKEAIVELWPRQGEKLLRHEDIIDKINESGNKLALVMLGNVNYLTGQAFDLQKIAEAAHKRGAFAGTNLAHGAGNLHLKLHDWGLDFAVWCSYKYLNSGPGSLAGCFVHERHLGQKDLPRFEGWWGNNKQTRFQMGPDFDPIPTAEAWQLSNPPIFQLAALRASMELFDQAGIGELRKKSELLTGYLEFLLDQIPNDYISITTPRDPLARGCQLSVTVGGDAKALVKDLSKKGVICDFREPNIIRLAPTPLYNSFEDVFKISEVLKSHS